MNKKYSRAWLITHHAPQQIFLNYSSITSSDLIIAVDGGFRKCLELNLVPNVLIGDFDSIEPALLDKLPPDCQKITHPAQKNETDTQLALEYCIENNIREVFICNDLGGRFDHSFALVQNLLQAHQNGINVKIVSEKQVVFILDSNTELTFPVNTIISLISLTDKTEFSFSNGLQFPLDGLTLYNWQSRGISNTISESTQYIKLTSGIALAIITPTLF